MALTKIPLSGSSYGAPIAISATSIGSGNTIHTSNGVTTPGLGDEVVLYCSNNTASAVVLTLGIGGVAAGNQLTISVPADATVQVLPGLMLQNSLVVYAAAASQPALNICGYVIRSQ
jgi:hypothetical protein